MFVEARSLAVAQEALFYVAEFNNLLRIGDITIIYNP
jgi:hypothetical protein